MTGQLYRDPWVKKAKWLTQALIISGTLNVGFLSTFIYFAIRKHAPHLSLELDRSSSELTKQLGMQDVLAKYGSLSFQDLLAMLGNREHVESGYTQRDLSLATLVSLHYFNLERALGGLALQKREVSFLHPQTNQETILTIFPGLADYQYQAIMQYAKTEKWPFTPEGLFAEIQKSKLPHDPSLLEAFYLTPEYHFLNLLFSKTGIPLKKEHLVVLLSQGKWSTIEKVAQDLRKTSLFAVEERRKFLLDLMEESSRLAAKILLETDLDYCSKHLDNGQVLFLCNLLGEKTNSLFLKELLLSPRSDEIWKKAASILYVQAAEEVPEVLDLEGAKRRFIELKVAAPTPTKPAAPKKQQAKTYTVASGDSLWKIANKHSITINALKEANQLKSDRLSVGQTLLIPAKE